jgi:hypothetical protein
MVAELSAPGARTTLWLGSPSISLMLVTFVCVMPAGVTHGAFISSGPLAATTGADCVSGSKNGRVPASATEEADTTAPAARSEGRVFFMGGPFAVYCSS